MTGRLGRDNAHVPEPPTPTPTPPVAPAPPLTAAALPQRLREATQALHTATERSGAMAELLAGRLSRPRYLALLRNLHALYAALEAALARCAADARVAPVDHPAQHRCTALVADLDALHGPDWATRLPVVAPMAAYVQRLQALAERRSPALVAHVYTRCLGDLHGGQILGRRVAQMLQLQGSAGTAFYRFGDDAVVQALRQRLREALTGLPLTAAEAQEVVDEACWSFRQHQAVFQAL